MDLLKELEEFGVPEFGNKKILELLKNRYNGLDFNIEKKHIGAIWFKNNIDSFPSEKNVLIAIKKLSEIFEIIIRAKKMKEKTKLLEDKLSDRLHEELTKTFIDKRASVLARGLKQDMEFKTEILEL